MNGETFLTRVIMVSAAVIIYLNGLELVPTWQVDEDIVIRAIAANTIDTNEIRFSRQTTLSSSLACRRCKVTLFINWQYESCHPEVICSLRAC